MINIHSKEKWLYENKKAMKQVKKGLEDSAMGNIKSRGSFIKYADEDD